MRRLTTYQDVREALRNRSLRQALYDDGHRLMDGVIVNLHGDAHVARRRLENRLFRRDTFAWYERSRIPDTIDTVLAPAVAVGRGELLNLARRTMMTLSVDIAGVDLPPAVNGSGALDDRAFDRFCTLMHELAAGSTVAHATGDKQAIIDAGDRALDEFATDFFAPSVERRRRLVERFEVGELGEDALPRDVVTTLLRNQDELELSPDHLLREIAYFPWVGSHSTSGQLVHAMHHVFEWIEAHPDDRSMLTREPEVLQRFVHESTRLHPASPVAMRMPLERVELESGAVLESGEVVALDIEAANRDPSIFGAEPDAFDPYRSILDGADRWGLSFGHGSHACLGKELAGGVAPDRDVESHLLGAITIMASEMLTAGARPDPERPAVLDANTTRRMWGLYPVLFGSASV